eukprot:6549154-Prymnesium_polylepis.1
MNIALEHAPNITISIDSTHSPSDDKPLPFFLTGPAHAKELLASILEEHTEEPDEQQQEPDRRKKSGRYHAVSGWLSPLREITLDYEARKGAGIPERATRITPQLKRAHL